MLRDTGNQASNDAPEPVAGISVLAP